MTPPPLQAPSNTKDALRQLAINDEGFAFDPRTGECFRLNSTAQFILKALKAGKPTEQVAHLLADDFKVPETSALEDVHDFLVQLKIQGLLA